MHFLGHRGSVHPTAPENTLASIERALRQGADGVEIDVRVTSDDIPVLHHDPTLKRTAGDHRSVSEVSYVELPWNGSHRVPRLAEALDLVVGKGRLVIELKAPQWPYVSATDAVDATIAVLRRHRLDDVTVSSFDRMRLRAVRAAGLPVRTALLGRPAVPASGVLRHAVADNHDELHLHLSSLRMSPRVVETAAAHGISVVAWTVNRPADVAFVADTGASGVISDDPAAARLALSPVGAAETA